jgi:hypothetical protein
MACGLVRAISAEVEYSDNPHINPRVVSTTVVPIDRDALEWVSAFPRHTYLGEDFLPASLRVKDANDLARAESEATSASNGAMLERVRSAGIPSAPATRWGSPYVAPYLAAYDALTMNASTPFATALSLASSDERVVAMIALDQIALRPDGFAEAARALETMSITSVAKTIASLRKTARQDQKDTLADALGARLAPLVAVADREEMDIDAIVAMLGSLASPSKRAESALRALAETSLASRRSALRDAIERALRGAAQRAT